MTDGSKRVILRLPDDVIEEIYECVSESLHARKGAPLTLSSWIRLAIVEKLAHRQRSRGRKSPVVHIEQEDGKRLFRPE